MYNFKLTDNLYSNDSWDKTIELNNLPTNKKAYRKAPVNWNKMQYAFTRNSKYYGLFPSFTAQLGLTNGGVRNANLKPSPSDGAKSWADNIFWKRGINGEILIDISAFNPQTRRYETFISGIGNSETIASKRYQTDVEVIDKLFIQDILNKDNTEFDYQQMTDSYSVDHLVNDIWETPTIYNNGFCTLRIYGQPKTNGDTGYVDNVAAVYPFQLFEKIVALMTGKRNAFYSSFFAKAGIDRDESGEFYTEDGPGAYILITTGRFIRGYKYSDMKNGTGIITSELGVKTIVGENTLFNTELAVGEQLRDSNGIIIGMIQSISDNSHLTLQNNAEYNYSGSFTYQNLSDNSTLIISFEKLFKAFSAIFCLGMTVKNNTNGFSYVSVEKLQNFYNNQVVAVINNPKDLTITFDQDWRCNEIEVGYNKFQKNKDNSYGNNEFNNKSLYSVPSKFIKKNFQITSDIRFDSTGIQLCMDNIKSPSEEDSSQDQFDNEIFGISSYNDGDRFRSRNNHNITVMPGSIYGDPTNGNYNLNFELSPARMLKNWGSIIRINTNDDLILTFQKSEQLTRLSTRLIGETNWVSDSANIPVKDFDKPFLSGYEANLSSQFGVSEILALKANPFGLIKFWDNINNVWRYGYVKEASTQPIDKKTNWKLAIATDDVDPIERRWKLKLLSGKYLQLLNGKDLLLINQN